jgi:hypothetical protein
MQRQPIQNGIFPKIRTSAVDNGPAVLGKIIRCQFIHLRGCLFSLANISSNNVFDLRQFNSASSRSLELPLLFTTDIKTGPSRENGKLGGQSYSPRLH